jgi:hypothetical protein
VCESGSIGPCILNLGISYRPDSRPGRFTRSEVSSVTIEKANPSGDTGS